MPAAGMHYTPFPFPPRDSLAVSVRLVTCEDPLKLPSRLETCPVVLPFPYLGGLISFCIKVTNPLFHFFGSRDVTPQR